MYWGKDFPTSMVTLRADPTSLLAVMLTAKSHTCDISLFRRELPIFCPFLRKSPYENFIISLYILYISLFGNPDFPIKIQKFPSLFNHSPYLEKEISLFVFPSVSHVCKSPFRPYAKKHFYMDRDPTRFRYILNYLRGGAHIESTTLPNDERSLMELLVEA